MTPRAANVTPADLQGFVQWEARLLDEQRFDEWNALFAPEGWYWLPARADATDPLAQASHLYDDHLLRSVKLKRLRSPQAHSQQPAGQCHHLLQASEVTRFEPELGSFELRTPFFYTELRAGHTTTLPGVFWHQLVWREGRLSILLKRVNLLHAAQPLPAIEFYL